MRIQKVSFAAVILPVCVSAALALPSEAQTAGREQATLIGTVMSDGQPVGIAEIGIMTGSVVRARGLTDARGTYRITLPAGTYDVRVRMPGYAAQTVSGVVLTVNGIARQDFRLVLQPIALEHITVTAQRKPEKATEAPAAIFVVDARRIEERPASTAVDHLHTMAGLDIATTGLQARSVVTRGFNEVFGTSLLMLSDYRYASLPSLRANLPYFLTPTDDDIDRIEVLLGPASAAYGPNGADGVVHLITKSPFVSPGTSASVTVGERSLLHVTARQAGLLSDRVAYKVSAQRFSGDDWTAEDPTEVTPRDPSVERYSAEARVDVRAGKATDIVLLAGSTLSANAVEQTGIGNAQIRDYKYHFAQARLTRGGFFAQAFINAASSGTSFQLQTLQPILDDSRLIAVQAQNSQSFGARTSILYGIDFSHTDPRTQGSISGRNEEDDRYTESGAYAQGQLRLNPRFDLVAAARLDRHSRMDDLVVSPRVAAVFMPRTGHNFRIAYNRAFQNPTSTDLFLDLVAAQLDPLPFALRAQGVPRSGYTFRRDCGGGLCAKSPFGDPDVFVTADATAYWGAVTAIMKSAGVDLTSIPAPTSSDVRTDLRVLDLATGGFRAVREADVRNIEALRPNISNTIEAGYKGLLKERFLIAVSTYVTRRENFQGPLQVETPNIFLNTDDLAVYLARFMPAPDAQQLAAGIGGLSQNAAVTGIPLATVSPEGPLGGSNIIMTYRNTGSVDLWGAELSAELLVNENWSTAIALSSISDDFIPQAEAGGFSDIALNAPRRKAAVSVAYRDMTRGLTGEIRARAVDGFPMTSGVWVGTVSGYNVVDATVSTRIPLRGAVLTLAVQNIADQKHAEFVGAPRIGRMLSSRLHFNF